MPNGKQRFEIPHSLQLPAEFKINNTTLNSNSRTDLSPYVSVAICATSESGPAVAPVAVQVALLAAAAAAAAAAC